MSKFTLSTTAALCGAVLSFGVATVAFAAPPQTKAQADLARCQQLYGLWSHYNGTSSYSHNVGPEMALQDCQGSNPDKGVAELTHILENARIPVPPTEAAASH
jgi:hypothetical protein